MPNRTEGVKTLVEEVLATLPTPYSEDVIDEVFLAIEANPTWLTVYNVLCNDLRSVTVVNQAVGSWTSKAVGRTGDHQVPSRSKLTESYSKLYPVVVLNREATVAEGPAGPLPLHAERPPLRVDEGGAVRVGKSRISLDLVIEQYENGMRPEDMVRAYDTLGLADVYAVIAFYLRHRDEVRAYLKRRAEEAQALRAKIEAEHPRVAREELLARRRARGTDHAPTGQ
jgi:uncharacterized protein (DUF433 family)